ncbi:MAG: glycosyltransferase family 4 protein [Acidimicrobiales bacterium]
MTPVRVLANLYWLVPGRVGGSEEYTVRLLAAVASAGAADVQVTVAAGTSAVAAPREHPARAVERLGGPTDRRPVRLVLESTVLALRSRPFDLVHHFGGRIPAVRGAPAVVTIHDLQPLDLPGNFSRVKRAYLGRALPRSARAARLVVTPSRWVADRVVDRLGVDPARVRAVPSTYDVATHATTPEDPTTDPVLAALGDDPVVLYPAMTHPHKDHATLIEAYRRVRDAHPGVRLVLTGAAGRSHEAVMRLVAATQGATHLGRVPGDRMVRLVARADALAFPSRYEGFGLPVLEAMRAGTPVVAAAATALPEIVGRAGALVEPGSVGEWADAIDEALSGGAEVRRRVTEARDRAGEHAPDRAAGRLLTAWRDVLVEPAG